MIGRGYLISYAQFAGNSTHLFILILHRARRESSLKVHSQTAKSYSRSLDNKIQLRSVNKIGSVATPVKPSN